MENDIKAKMDKFVHETPHESLDAVIRVVEKFVGESKVPISEFTHSEQKDTIQLQKYGLVEIKRPQYDEPPVVTAPVHQDIKRQHDKSFYILLCDASESLKKLKAKKANESDDLKLQAEE